MILIDLIDRLIHPFMQQIFLYVSIAFLLSLLFKATPFYSPTCRLIARHKISCINALKDFFIKPLKAMDFDKDIDPKPTGKFTAWGYTILYSQYAMWFIATGTSLGILIFLKNANQPLEPIQLTYGILFCGALQFMGYWYRGCAYLIARENNINLKPWLYFLKR